MSHLRVDDALRLPRAGIRVRGLWEGMQRQGGGGNGPAPLGPNGVPVNVHDMVRDQVRASLRWAVSPLLHLECYAIVLPHCRHAQVCCTDCMTRVLSP